MTMFDVDKYVARGAAKSMSRRYVKVDGKWVEVKLPPPEVLIQYGTEGTEVYLIEDGKPVRVVVPEGVDPRDVAKRLMSE